MKILKNLECPDAYQNQNLLVQVVQEVTYCQENAVESIAAYFVDLITFAKAKTRSMATYKGCDDASMQQRTTYGLSMYIEQNMKCCKILCW